MQHVLIPQQHLTRSLRTTESQISHDTSGLYNRQQQATQLQHHVPARRLATRPPSALGTLAVTLDAKAGPGSQST